MPAVSRVDLRVHAHPLHSNPALGLRVAWEIQR
jgi:hypothetical protein